MIRDFTETPVVEQALLRGLEVLSRTVEKILGPYPLHKYRRRRKTPRRALKTKPERIIKTA